jgi:hypothetical protein
VAQQGLAGGVEVDAATAPVTNIEVQRRSTMTIRTLIPTVSVPSGTRFLAALRRYFSRSVVTREAVDQAWIDSGLGRPSAATLQDIGAPPRLIARAEQRAAWKLAAALDATRHL